MMCEHKNMGDYLCRDCGMTIDDISFESLNKQLAAANARVAELEEDLNESHVDEHGTVWTRPTAEAYCLICKAYDTWKTKAEQAEAQCSELRNLNAILSKDIEDAMEIRETLVVGSKARIEALLEQNRRMREALEDMAREGNFELQVYGPPKFIYTKNALLAQQVLKGDKE